MIKKEREMAKQQKCRVGGGRGREKKLSGTGSETGKGKERQISDVTDSEIDSSTGSQASDTDSDAMEIENIRPQRRRNCQLAIELTMRKMKMMGFCAAFATSMYQIIWLPRQYFG